MLVTHTRRIVRRQVSKHALEAVLEPMLLERMVQQIAARAEPLLFQRHAAQWLDEICAGSFMHHHLALLHAGSLHRDLGREAARSTKSASVPLSVAVPCRECNALTHTGERGELIQT